MTSPFLDDTPLHERSHPATHRLIEAVGDRNDRAAAALLLTASRRELVDLVVHCARLVNATDPGPTAQRRGALMPHGTHAAFNRHRNAGETPCHDCVIGERDYQRIRGAQRRYRARNEARVAAAITELATPWRTA